MVMVRLCFVYASYMVGIFFEEVFGLVKSGGSNFSVFEILLVWGR